MQCNSWLQLAVLRVHKPVQSSVGKQCVVVKEVGRVGRFVFIQLTPELLALLTDNPQKIQTKIYNIQ